MCDCKDTIEASVADYWLESNEGVIDPSAKLLGYSFVLSETVEYRPFMEARVSFTKENKKGEVRAKTAKMTVAFSYCPFCGESFTADEKDAA